VKEALFQPLVRDMAEIVLDGHDHPVDWRNREVGQLRLAQDQCQAAALGDLQRVGNRTGHIGKQGLHLGGRFEVLLTREAAHPARIGQDLTLRNADTGFMRFIVVCFQELDRVRGHHGQMQPGSQLHGSLHMGLIVGTARTLQLQIKTVRKDRGQLQRNFGSLAGIALHQRCTQRSCLRTRQQDQAFAQFLQPLQLDDRLCLDHILGPATGQQFTQVQIALLALHQQNHTRSLGWITRKTLDLDFTAQNRFDPLGPAFLVELDAAEQVVQVGDGQGRLPVPGCAFDDVIDAAGGIDNGKLGVKAQMDKHAADFRAHGQSRSKCTTSERNSRPYRINTTKAVATTRARGEKNQAMAAKEK